MKIIALLRLLRVSQWLKNLLIFFPPFLGGVIFQPGMIFRGIIPFVSFCLASSATYILNDIFDRENDAHHPLKKQRPIPAETVRVPAASLICGLLLVASLCLAADVSIKFMLILLAYLAISISYSIKLKNLPVVDIFCVSAGFLLRLHGGGVAFDITVSEWLFLSVFLLSVFLSTGKRLSEIKSLGEAAGLHRKSLRSYPDGFFEGTMYMTGGAVLVTYAMYIISRHAMVYTVPLCAFGLLRYIFRVKVGLGGDPIESLLKDVPLLIVGVLWTVMVGWGMYAP